MDYYDQTSQNVNFELTRLYLELISTHIAMQLLLARIDTRRLVVALFNLAHEAMMVYTVSYSWAFTFPSSRGLLVCTVLVHRSH